CFMISRARKNNHAHPPVAASNRQHSHASTSPQYGHSHIHASIRFPQYSQLTPSALFVFLALLANMVFSFSNLLYFMSFLRVVWFNTNYKMLIARKYRRTQFRKGISTT